MLSPHRFFIAAIAAIGGLYLCVALCAPLAAIDAYYLPDDTYYTLSIARNIAAGLGPSADGIIQTTGFQPLIALILQPVFWLGADADSALRAAIVISSVFGILATVLAGGMTREATGSSIVAGCVVLLIGLSPRVLGNAFNGLESTLATSIFLGLIWMAASTTSNAPRGRLVALGCIAGLALWARIDAVLVIAVLIPVAIWRLGLLRTGIVAAAATVSVAPWVVYCLTESGHLIPESGSAVRQILAYHSDIGRTVGENITAALAAPSLALLPVLHPSIAAWGSVLLLLPVLWAWQRKAMDAPALLALAGMAMVAFYAVYLPAFWFFHRYLLLASIALIVGAATFAWARGLGTRAIVVATAVLCTQQVYTQLPHFRTVIGFEDSFRTGHNYGHVARQLMPILPDGAVLGAMQSGALNWYAERGVRVVNLDGVVNADAKAAIGEGQLDAFLKDVGATHFADWPLNRNWLQAASTSPVPLTPIGAVADHLVKGQDFTMYRIDWP
ncbi:hypothetical protein N9O61_00135 [Octadecabacter sp.]|nr:hypothetical protein [Octadecabacter sp.]